MLPCLTPRNSALVVTALLCASAALVVQARAENEAQANPESDWRYLEYMEKPHRWVSRRLGDTSRQIDGFFSTKNLYDEVSGTYGEFRIRERLSELDSNELDVDFRLKLRIPYTKDKLKLLLESDSDERETEAGQLGSVSDRVLGEANDRDNDDDRRGGVSSIFAGLRQEIVNASGFKIDLDAGIKLDFPPDPFVRGKFRRLWEYQEWSLRFTESPYWFTSDGFGHRSELDLDRRLSQNWATRASVRYKWEDEDDVDRLANSLSFYRLAGQRTYVALVGSAFFDDEGREFSERGYSAALQLRRRLYSQWLFLEAIPQVVWLRENNFEPSLAFSLGIEILFGEKYLKDVQEELLPPGEGDARGGVLARQDPHSHQKQRARLLAAMP